MNQKIKIKYIYTGVVLFFSIAGYSQNFEWLKTYGTGGSQDYIYTISAEPNGGCTFLCQVNFVNNYPPDSVFFGSYKFSTIVDTIGLYLVRLDSNGRVMKVKSIGGFELYNGKMCRDEEGSYYIGAYLMKDKNRVDTLSLNVKDGRTVFIKYDKDFNLIWVHQTGISKTILLGTFVRLIYSVSRVYFICDARDTTKIGQTTYYFGRLSNTQLFGELNPLNGQMKWFNYFYSPTGYSRFRISDMLFLQEKLYLSGDFGFGINEFVVIGKDTLYGPGGFVIEADTLGVYNKSFTLNNQKELNVECLATDGKNLYFGGRFRDSLTWGNKKIAPEFPTGSGTYFFKKSELFAASITSSFQPRWFFRPRIIDTSSLGASLITTMKFSNGFLYYGGQLNDNIKIGNQTLTIGVLLFKTDPIGNILWATASGNTAMPFGMDAIAKKSVFVGGYYMNYIQLGTHKDTAKRQNNPDAWITKITDYDITRGKVSGGPYCAGDTIKVPYTHIGNFDTSNYFIAELSDENGNFEGGQRELGRIKTNQDSVILGTLPLFQVSTSLGYRIRVRSTKPAIQSYYILDTLRLLIYSRDKADPGPPDTICYRDTFKLNTFGGTKWTWSPKYLMNDSTLRQPLIWPDTTTVYQIIIADSSGCGAPDTAFKTIYVKPKPILFGDTVYNKCDGQDLKLKVGTLYADSSGHKVRWYLNNNLYFSNDSMIYGDESAVTFLAVLTDNCSPAKDTMKVRVNYFGPLKVVRPKDTVVCFGDEMVLSAKATGGIAAQYVFNWFNSFGSWIGSGTPTVTITKTDTFKVVLSDGCSVNLDSAFQIVSLSKKINTKEAMGLPNDTTFCGSFSATLKIKNTDKDDQYSWIDLNDQLSVGIRDTLRWAKAGTLEATVTNSCGTTKDTIVIKQLATPKIKLDSLYDACENISLKLDISNPKNEETYLWSTAETTPAITTTKAGDYWAKAMNYCGTDSVSFKVVLYPKPIPNFTVADVCEGELVPFQNKTTGGKVFEWRFGDGTISGDSTPNKTYTITQSSRTYFVTLLAKISSNCRDSISKPLNVKAISDGAFTYNSQGKTVFFTQTATESGESYQWHFGDGDSSTQTNPTHQFKADSGTYNVCLNILNAANCRSRVCSLVRYSVGIEEPETGFFRVYPNPTEGVVYLTFVNPVSHAGITIFDMLGEIVSEESTLHGISFKLSLGQFNSGVYIIRVTHSGITTNRRIVLMK